MEKIITIWPFIVTVAFMLIVIGCYKFKNRKRFKKLVLNSCYSLDSQGNLLINNRPPIVTVPQIVCNSKINQVIFNINGDILVYTEGNQKSGWHRFSKKGIDLGLIDAKDWKDMQKRYPLLHYGRCYKYKVNSKNIITVYLALS